MRVLMWFSVVASFFAAFFLAGLMGLGLWLIFWLIFWALTRKRPRREESPQERQRRAAADQRGIDRANKRRQDIERLQADNARRKAERKARRSK